MFSTGQLLGFAVASLVLIVVPGPGVLFIVGRALAHGRRTAAATALGHAGGNYVVAACVAVGLGTVLERSAEAFIIVKIAGALYLIWLGIHAIRQRKSLAEAMAVAAPPRGKGGGRRGMGVLVGLTNPKAYILFGAILPQFVNRTAGHVPEQMLVLALVSVAIGGRVIEERDPDEVRSAAGSRASRLKPDAVPKPGLRRHPGGAGHRARDRARRHAPPAVHPMRVARSFGPGDVRLEEDPDPEPGPGEVVCEVLACGVCASDVTDWYIAPRLPRASGTS